MLPGDTHSNGRIRHIAVALPGIVGPFTPVCLKMTLMANSLRIDNTAGRAANYPRNTNSKGMPTNDSRVLDNVAMTQFIATSTAVNDNGLFEMNMKDERYVPFEGAGAISSWQLQLTPDSSYQYRNSGGTITVITANTTGSWLLCSNGAPGPCNRMRQTIEPSTGNINATMGNTIGPSDIITMKPWGAGFGETPNPIDDDAPSSNAEIISANNSVRSTLIAGDPRKNYIFRGAMWTSDGGAPLGVFPGNEFGTTALSNVTMETFQQGQTISAFTGVNCFGCHNAAVPGPVCDTGIAHIWPFLQRLF